MSSPPNNLAVVLASGNRQILDQLIKLNLGQAEQTAAILNSANSRDALLRAILAELQTIAAQEPQDANLSDQLTTIINLLTPPPIVLAGVTVTVTEKEK